MKKATDESMRIAGYIAQFLNEYASAQLTNSTNTLRSYQNTLALYMTFLENEKKITYTCLKGSCFTRIMVEEWMTWLKEKRSCSPENCNNRLSSLRAFLKFLGSRDVSYLYLYQEATGIPRRKGIKKKVEGLTREAVKALMESPDPSSRTGRRDMAFMILMYGTAARMDEVLSMKNKQLQLNAPKPCATVIGKGNKIRTLYLLPKVVAHLKQYQKEFHGDFPEPEAYVFYSRNTGIYGKMTQPAMDKVLKKHAGIAHEICKEVPLGLHAHQLRHAKASHWLEDGMNIIQISFLLGHEQLQTTMIYLDITTEDEIRALATLEDEKDKKVSPKWKKADGSLLDFCGITRKR